MKKAHPPTAHRTSVRTKKLGSRDEADAAMVLWMMMIAMLQWGGREARTRMKGQQLSSHRTSSDCRVLDEEAVTTRVGGWICVNFGT